MIIHTISARRAIAVIIVWAFSFPAAAPVSHGSLKGILFSSKGGHGIAAVRVFLDKTGLDAYTLSDGGFSFPPIEPGRYLLRLFSSRTGARSVECEVKANTETFLKIGFDSSKLEVNALYSDLPHGTITGRIYAASPKEPLKNAVVRISGLTVTAVTDSLGYYTLNNIGAGDYTITAEVAGCPLASADVAISPGTERKLDLVQGLPKRKKKNALPTSFGTITGAITDSRTSRPIEAAQVTVAASGMTVNADETGVFRIGDLQSSCYDLSILASGYGEMRVNGVPVLPLQVTNVSIFCNPSGACEYNLVITPWQQGSIAITTLDAVNGAPLSGATVFIEGIADTFSTDSGGVALIPDVSSGTWSGFITADGYSPVTLSVVRVIENRVSRYTVNLTPPAARGPEDTLVAVSAEALKRGLMPATTAPAADSAPAAMAGARNTTEPTRSDAGSPSVSGTDSVKRLERMSVRSAAVRNSDAGMLREKESSVAMIDGISSAEISRAGASNAADAMRKITGATVMDGKYVYIRGLGERYNITLLDGAEAPSPDPDKQAVPMNLFPAALIDNIATIKAATADMPGNWSGGCLDIRTKSFPDKPLFSLGIGSGANTITTGRTDFLTYEGGKLDWLAIDDGTRAVPERLRDTSIGIPTKMEALVVDKTHGKARLLDTLTKSFMPVMSPSAMRAPPNQSYSLAIGNKYSPFDMPLGLISSFSYSHKYQMYNNGKVTKYRLLKVSDTGKPVFTQVPLESYENNKSKESVLWGGLARASFEPRERQIIQLDYLYVRHGEDIAQQKWGEPDPFSSSEGTHVVSSMLDYVEQGMGSISIRGTHAVPLLENTKFDGAFINWRRSRIDATQNEPDLRYFYRSWKYNDDSTMRVWNLNYTIYTFPTRYFRSLTETTENLSLDCGTPLPLPLADSASVKAGFAWKSKRRAFKERRFYYDQGFLLPSASGDPAEFLMTDSILGVKDTSPRWVLGNFIVDGFELRNNYHGRSFKRSGYAMADIVLSPSIRLTGGVRLEQSSMYSASEDTTIHKDTVPLWFSRLTNMDLLPSAGCILTPAENMNVRLSFFKAMLYPSFREITPYSSFEFKKEKTYYGTIDLKPTECYNFDARWEWFYRPGQLFSAGVFYKRFINHIDPYVEMPIKQDLLQPMNSPNGYAAGLEIEARAALDLILPELRDISVGGNVALIEAKTRLSNAEKGGYIEPETYPPPEWRTSSNASPYVANASLQYANERIGLTGGLYFNVVGPQMTDLFAGPLGDIHETALYQLDLVCSYTFARLITVKGAVFNLLNNDNQAVSLRETAPLEDLASDEAKGITFSLGVSFSF